MDIWSVLFYADVNEGKMLSAQLRRGTCSFFFNKMNDAKPALSLHGV